MSVICQTCTAMNKIYGLYVGGTHILLVKGDMFINKFNKLLQL